MNDYNEVKVRFEELEIRTGEDYPEPFPLYPYENLYFDISPFTILKDNEALCLRAEQPFIDEREQNKIERFVGDEYLYRGPGTYIPKIEESV